MGKLRKGTSDGKQALQLLVRWPRDVLTPGSGLLEGCVWSLHSQCQLGLGQVLYRGYQTRPGPQDTFLSD